MNKNLLNSHIDAYLQTQKADPVKAAEAKEDRAKRLQIYASWNAGRMRSAAQEDLVELFSPLWSMAMWGNKEYQVNQMIADNGLGNLCGQLADLLWGGEALAVRWDHFPKNIKWIGPGMMSELLGYVHPEDCIIWNKVTISALNHFGFATRIEVVVSPGSRVDAVWEATIGNMGRVIYVFEVQTQGSIDSLILNLLKSKKNPAVQGVVAISDAVQLKKIQEHAADVDGLGNLRCWDYTDVLVTHQRLEAVNQTINGLNLVPKGFGG